jgi:D-glycero-alpha-D-manno-heptose 1-phosphate guanylyltransferase
MPSWDMTAVLLVGGRGARIADLHPDLPKPLIPVNGAPFLGYVLQWLNAQGVGEIILATGHQGNKIDTWARSLTLPSNMTVTCRREREPLGTGGAVRSVLDLCRESVLVVNGDSLSLANLAPINRRFEEEKDLEAMIVGKPVDNASRFGTLRTDSSGQILLGFEEKKPGSGDINCGLYFFRRPTLLRFSSGIFLSMETDILPNLLDQGSRIGVASVDVPFTDIGIPDALREAGEFVRRNSLTAIT